MEYKEKPTPEKIEEYIFKCYYEDGSVNGVIATTEEEFWKVYFSLINNKEVTRFVHTNPVIGRGNELISYTKEFNFDYTNYLLFTAAGLLSTFCFVITISTATSLDETINLVKNIAIIILVALQMFADFITVTNGNPQSGYKDSAEMKHMYLWSQQKRLLWLLGIANATAFIMSIMKKVS